MAQKGHKRGATRVMEGRIVRDVEKKKWDDHRVRVVVGDNKLGGCRWMITWGVVGWQRRGVVFGCRQGVGSLFGFSKNLTKNYQKMAEKLSFTGEIQKLIFWPFPIVWEDNVAGRQRGGGFDNALNRVSFLCENNFSCCRFNGRCGRLGLMAGRPGRATKKLGARVVLWLID